MKYLLILLLLVSCATRKVNKTTEEIKQVSTEVVQNNIQTKQDSIVFIADSTTEICIEPVDSIKPMVIDGKTYVNAKISLKKRKVNTSIALKKIVSDTSLKTSSKKIEATKSEKITERKSGFNWWWLLLLIIPAGIYGYIKLT